MSADRAENPVDLSVLVAASRASLDRLRRSVESVTTSSEVEIVVAAVDREAADFAQQLGESVRVVDAVGQSRGRALQRAQRDARGPVVVWLDESAVLEADGLDRLAGAIAAGADAAYGDHVVEGDHLGRAFPPAFSPARLRGQHYFGPAVAAHRSTAARLAAPTEQATGAEFHDLAMRLAEVSARIDRVPEVVASSATSISVPFEARRLAVAAHCERMGIDAEIEPTAVNDVVRVRRRLSSAPSISVIIPTRGSSGIVAGSERVFVMEAVRSLVEVSSFQPTEFVVVYDSDTPETVLDELRRLVGDRLVLIEFAGPFNFSAKINAGVEAATGKLLLLLNDDTELIESTSLETMVAHLQTSDVGMVGAKLLFEDGTLQHGGHVYAGKIHHACLGWPGDDPGPTPLVPLAVERECSGVTAAVALVTRPVFDEVAGFDTDLPLNYNDVDFSLKVRAAGHRIIWTPHAVWFHYESRTRDSTLCDGEIARIEARWGSELRHDPYYHPALSPDVGDWTPAVIESPVEPPRPAAASLRERVVAGVLGPAPPRPRGVNLVGYLDATSGLGDRARQLGDVLELAGIRHSRWHLDLTDSARGDERRPARPDDGVVFDTTIAVVTALAFPGLPGAFPALVHDVDRVIGYWFWELDDIPATHSAGIALVDEIWAPTRFVAEAYGRSCDLPVELVPLPIAEPTPSPTDRLDVGSDDDTAVFLTSFDWLSSVQRKNPYGVIDAFGRAFPNGDEPARLVVKSINGHRRRDGVRHLREFAAHDPRIELRDEYLSRADQSALIAAADALVSLHRSEGLGLHIAEAMWLETPVIATDYSGSVDVTKPSADGDVALQISADLVEVVDGGEAYQGGRWADPDLDEAAAAMRLVASRPADVDEMVARARTAIQTRSDPARAAADVSAALRRRARPRSRREVVGAAVRSARGAVRSALDRRSAAQRHR